MSKIDVVAIAGATATGKTAYAVQFAKENNGEIISCDSMQIYRRMNIGTAKVTVEEAEGIPHHMVDVVEPYENFSVAMYCNMASECIRDIASRGKLPIVAGGTGLYMDNLLSATNFREDAQDLTIRDAIAKEISEKGNAHMHMELMAIDPVAANRIHVNDTKRLSRAIEIFRTHNMTMTEMIEKSRLENPYNVRHIGLAYRNREELYAKINLRVDIMMDMGLLDEVRELIKDDRVLKSTAIMGIGYKELVRHLDGEISLLEAVDTIKQESRRYAKRQMTWFRREVNREWIYR